MKLLSFFHNASLDSQTFWNISGVLIIKSTVFLASGNQKVLKLNLAYQHKFLLICMLFVVYFLQGSMLTQSEGQSKGHVFWFLGSSSSCCSFDQFLGEQQCKGNFEWTCWKRSS